MRNFRNLIVILFCWSVGNAVYAKTSELLEKDGQKFVDPSLPKISAPFDLTFENDATSNSSSVCGSCNLPEANKLEFFSFQETQYRSFENNFLKKSYLFISSGLSPPHSV